MNNDKLINWAENAILDADPADAFRWIIVVRERQIICTPMQNRIDSETVIMKLSQRQIKNGLTNDGWDTLGRLLAEYWKQNSL